MPREKQKRGRRAEKKEQEEAKRKRETAEDAPTTKRQKHSDYDDDTGIAPENDIIEQGADYVPLGDYHEGGDHYEAGDETPFYGLLDPEEQEYFSRAGEMLELNQFQDLEERRLFLDSVYEEANGKELKVACSQSCSRLMEKLIWMSNTEQVKRLFSKFSGHFLHLVQHRFASHCCETLFEKATTAITHDMSKSSKSKRKDSAEEDQEETHMSTEELFLKTIGELEGNWGYLLTERFASHAIRVLLLVLAGEPLDKPSNASLLASRKKEKPGATGISKGDDTTPQKRTVPESFAAVLQKMMKDIVDGLDNTYLRALATHPVGNPVLQVMLSIELRHQGKARAKDQSSVIRKLIPEDSLEEGTESAAFLKSLLYDPVGSRLLETIVPLAPGKLFKNIYKNVFKDRMGTLARNEIAGYVVSHVLERLSKEDLQNAMEQILHEIPSLVERSRVVVIKTLIQRCVVRTVDLGPLTSALKSAYGDDPATMLDKLLKLGPQPELDTEKQQVTRPKSTPEQLHGSLLAQEMLRVSGPMSGLIHSSLLAVPGPTIIRIAKDPTASHVLQDALSLPSSTIQFRRQIIPRFFGNMSDIALDTSGSHVADVLWSATKDLIFIKERLAKELVESEQDLRDSFFGRAVWRNWSMDLFKRRRGYWVAKAKGLEENSHESEEGKKPKSGIELARARFAAKENAKSSDGRAPVSASS
ncbi:Nucleolar protein 9 [Arachnomyces sp. PD_36]|nr:Nucleolar protein 9 [Arachnomyces sp. PD_36]